LPAPIADCLPTRLPLADTFHGASAMRCGGWHESSAELMDGLQVVEHAGLTDADRSVLMDALRVLVSFD